MDQPFEAMGPVVDYEVPIRYSDMDLFGHVNNATYFSFLEEARIAWFEACIPEKWDFEKHGVLVARNEMDYLKPVIPGDRLIIRVGASGMGNSSIHVKYEGFVLHGGRRTRRTRLSRRHDARELGHKGGQGLPGARALAQGHHGSVSSVRLNRRADTPGSAKAEGWGEHPTRG